MELVNVLIYLVAFLLVACTQIVVVWWLNNRLVPAHNLLDDDVEELEENLDRAWGELIDLRVKMRRLEQERGETRASNTASSSAA
ncbi:hypothetical protein [Corynebacterium sp.]|uniref:hypothetical protein n=1 Tax=Corynebacterium sp. TaxID=1720 RepID=UPI0028AAE0A8|nr:hypothetical protein [Corynebacterium sp.]